MPTSIRLDPRAENLLNRIAKRRGQTRSEVVRDAIKLLADETANATGRARRETAYDRLAHVIGIADSGGAELAVRTGERFREQLAVKARARRSR